MMRRLIERSMVTMAAMAVAAMAQPALAADAPSALPILSMTAALAPIANIAAPAAVSPMTAATMIPATDYSLHALIDTTPALPHITLDDQANRLRRGFGGTMVDYFLLGGDGFHISGGSRFYSRGPVRAGTIDARGLVDMRYVTLLYSPRSVLARASRRMTPALTLGYTKLIQGGISLGIEGGAMLGRFDTLAGSLARAPRIRGAGFSDGASQLSQIARVTFGYHF